GSSGGSAYTGSYGASSYETGSYGYGTAPAEVPSPYGGAYGSVDPAPAGYDSGPSYTGAYGSVDPAPAGYDSAPPYTGSYGGSAPGPTPYGSGPEYPGSYGAAAPDPAPSAYDTGSSYPGSYGVAAAHDPPPSAYGSGPYGADPAPSYDAGSYGGAAYGTASADPAPPAHDGGSYGGSGYPGAPAEVPGYDGYGRTPSAVPAPSTHDSGSYGGDGRRYGTGSPSAGSYGTHAAPADAEPSSYAGSYEAYGGRDGGSYGGPSTQDSYGAYAGGPAVSTPDSSVSEPFLPPAYERPADRYRSIPAVSNPNRPPPGEYGLRSAEPPMTDYLTREPIPEPPSLVPVPP